VQAELRPGVHLEQLVERSQPAGQRDEGVGEIGHQRLALVHRVDDVELREAQVGDLALDERAWDHPDRLTAFRENGLGEPAHEPD
jgi:hypothetical protein